MKLFTISVSSLSTRDFTNLITLAVSFNRVVIFVCVILISFELFLLEVILWWCQHTNYNNAETRLTCRNYSKPIPIVACVVLECQYEQWCPCVSLIECEQRFWRYHLTIFLEWRILFLLTFGRTKWNNQEDSFSSYLWKKLNSSRWSTDDSISLTDIGPNYRSTWNVKPWNPSF